MLGRSRGWGRGRLHGLVVGLDVIGYCAGEGLGVGRLALLGAVLGLGLLGAPGTLGPLDGYVRGCSLSGALTSRAELAFLGCAVSLSWDGAEETRDFVARPLLALVFVDVLWVCWEDLEELMNVGSVSDGVCECFWRVEEEADAALRASLALPSSGVDESVDLLERLIGHAYWCEGDGARVFLNHWSQGPFGRNFVARDCVRVCVAEDVSAVAELAECLASAPEAGHEEGESMEGLLRRQVGRDAVDEEAWRKKSAALSVVAPSAAAGVLLGGRVRAAVLLLLHGVGRVVGGGVRLGRRHKLEVAHKRVR